MNCSTPGSSVHRISSARILGELPFPSPSGFSWCRAQTCISYSGRQILSHSAIREAWSLLAIDPIYFKINNFIHIYMTYTYNGIIYFIYHHLYPLCGIYLYFHQIFLGQSFSNWSNFFFFKWGLFGKVCIHFLILKTEGIMWRSSR